MCCLHNFKVFINIDTGKQRYAVYIYTRLRTEQLYTTIKLLKFKFITNPQPRQNSVGGPYAAFGGKDASRGLATFSVTSSDKEYDDLSDLNSMEMESVKEWEAQFRGMCNWIGSRQLRNINEWTNHENSFIQSLMDCIITLNAISSPSIL